MDSEELIALDVGEKRIGVARANTIAKLAEPLTTINVDGSEVEQINDICEKHDAKKLVIGLPRNQSGEETKQSELVRDFAEHLKEYEIIWQDESLTSVSAEEKLRQSRKKFEKSDIDSLAATQILSDYLGTL